MNTGIANSSVIGPPGMINSLIRDTSDRAKWVDFTNKVDKDMGRNPNGYYNGESGWEIHQRQSVYAPFQEVQASSYGTSHKTTFTYVYTGNQTGSYASKSPFTGKTMSSLPNVDHTPSSPSWSGCQFGWWLQLPSVTAIYENMEGVNEHNEVMFEYMAVATVEGNGVEQSRRSLIGGSRSLLQTATPAPVPPTAADTGVTASNRGNWDSKTVACGGMDINVPVSGPITCTNVAVEIPPSNNSDDDDLNVLIPIVAVVGCLLILVLIILTTLQMASYKQQLKLNTMMSHPLLRKGPDTMHESEGGGQTSVGTVMSAAALVLGRPRVDTLV